MFTITENCKGSCLFHCYYKNSILILLTGIIIGVFLEKQFLNKTNESNI